MSEALGAFLQAKRLAEESFAASSASEIVAKTLKNELPRNGYLDNGFEYLIHGVGYTVVFLDGRQAHLDSNGDNDFFTIYDVRMYLSNGGEVAAPSLEEINEACDALARGLRIKRISEVAFEIVSQ